MRSVDTGSGRVSLLPVFLIRGRVRGWGAAADVTRESMPGVARRGYPAAKNGRCADDAEATRCYAGLHSSAAGLMSSAAGDRDPERQSAAVSGPLFAALVVTAVLGLVIYLTPPHLGGPRP